MQREVLEMNERYGDVSAEKYSGIFSMEDK